jgi:integrase
MAQIEKRKGKKGKTYSMRVYDRTTGTQKRFTAKSQKELKLIAAEWENGIKRRAVPANMTVDEAVADYITSKEGVLSPSTIRGYEIIHRNALGDLGDIKLKSITEKELQKWVSENAKKYSPKGIKNQFGLVTAALRQNKIQLDFNSIKLPELKKYEPNIPTEEEIARILTIVEGTNVELPVTIAVTLGLRQSEIAALKWEDYDGEFIHIHSARVPDKHNKLVVKDTTKSKASTRVLEVDDVLKTRLDRAEHKSEYISTMQPNSVLKRFQQLCEREGLPHFTMHGQRHGNASLMLAQGVPDKYAMERLGQSSPNMIKNVYQHLYDAKKKEISKTMSNKFSDIMKQKQN